MAEQTTQQRLAAVLAADVAGYTRLIERNSAGTVAAWQNVRDGVINPTIASFSGRIVKLTGDGFLAEFSTIHETVECALALQRGFQGSGLEFRIGVNLGDIFDDGQDIHGEGVNIAARIEALAPPGGICVSGAIYEQVRNRVTASFEDLGEIEVKNVSRPVRVYQIAPESGFAGSGAPRKGPALRYAVVALLLAVILAAGGLWGWMPAPVPRERDAAVSVPSVKPTIAVLPFSNFSGDKDQEYFSDGLTEDLITDISKVSGLSVIARNSTFSFKGRSPDVREVGSALGVTHVVEGSVRKSGGRLRINVQLIDAASGKHLWAERYDRNLTDVFAIQDEVVGHIIKSLALTLTPQEAKRLARRGTGSLEAFDLYMKGRQQESYFNRDALDRAQNLFQKAIALDPEYAEAYAHLAQVFSLKAEFNMVEDVDGAYRRSLELAEKAIALNPDLPYAHWSLGRTLSRPAFKQFDRAIREAETAVTLDPNFADGYASLGVYYAFAGQAEKSEALIRKAMRVNPIPPFWYHQALGVAHFMLADYAAAIDQLRIAVDRNPNFVISRQWLAASLAMAGKIEDAEWEVSELEAMGFNRTLDEMMDQALVVFPEYRDRYREALRRAGFS
ncbi:MAG: tetratricopeptide repeat protein [Hyphomicrobiales bacterium]|nr:tetratricopeptide repeat protein [Hyphomicrobiales bacterium]MCP5374123.1 tetratricopeptide repeat protein [Hyphomicrobiales bacterium]